MGILPMTRVWTLGDRHGVALRRPDSRSRPILQRTPPPRSHRPRTPIDGGAVQAYKVHRCEQPADVWSDIAPALKPEPKLEDQARGKELEYRVLAVNKAGEGEPSNTVMAVL